MHNLLRDADNERWLTLVTVLMGLLEPVPTLRTVSRRFLFRIGYEECLPFRKHIHMRVRSKSNGCLGAAMKHDHQGQRLSPVAARDIELVGACASRIGIDPIDKLPA